MSIAPLFDRLRESSEGVAGAGGGPAVARRALVDSVARELQLLLNTHGSMAETELERYPEVRSSVLNYGMPSLTGMAASSVNAGNVAERIRLAIRAFEPRLREVRVVAQPIDTAQPRLVFHVHGVLLLGDSQAPVMLETQIGLGAGDVHVRSGG